MKKLLCLVLVVLCLMPQASFVSAAPSLAAPILKVSAPTYNTVHLSWSAVKGAGGYRIYYKTGGKYVYLRSISATSYDDTDSIKEQTAYSYKVCAYYASLGGRIVFGALSAASSVITPSSLAFTVENLSSGSNKLAWAAYDGAAGYDIYRSVTAGGVYRLIGTTTTLKYTDTGLAANTTYYYKVRYYTLKNNAKSSAGFSAYLSARTLPAGAKYLVVCFVGNSYTFVPETNGIFQKLCDATGKHVKVYSDMVGGSTLQYHQEQFHKGYFADERKLTDIAVFQEAGGLWADPEIIKSLYRYFPDKTKKYYMTAVAPNRLEDVPQMEMAQMPDLVRLKTLYLFYQLEQGKDRSVFYMADGWHPSPMYGYACASLIYCTIFGGVPNKLPYDFLDPELIPGKTAKEKTEFIKYEQKCVKWALAQ